MNNKKKIVAVIPVRKGSKGIQDKNIVNFKGKPMMAWTIEQAMDLLKIGLISRVIVSTNSKVYAVLAKDLGAEVLFRPNLISMDESLDIECFQHVLNTLNLNNYFPDIFLHLRATYPDRKVSDIKKALEAFLSHEVATSLRSVTKSGKPVWKRYFKCWDGSITPCIPTSSLSNEYPNMPRQLLDPDYSHNGCIDIVEAGTVLSGSMSGEYILPFFMNEEEVKDIDKPKELEKINFETEFKELPKDKTFCFDIDGVICTSVFNCDYKKALPISSGIKLVNELYKRNYIILFTARGTLTEINWENETREQLERWKVNYHELKFGKPAANYYIDDKFVNVHLLKRRILDNEK